MPNATGSARQVAPTEVSRPRAVGPARVLALAYGFFTIAAGARSAVQLATHFSRAPIAYLLSAVAATVYLTGTVAMLVAERHSSGLRWARRLSLAELSGVALVGTVSLATPQTFPDATVWSGFGAGYAFVPVALPLAALAWIRSCTPGARHG